MVHRLDELVSNMVAAVAVLLFVLLLLVIGFLGLWTLIWLFSPVGGAGSVAPGSYLPW